MAPGGATGRAATWYDLPGGTRPDRGAQRVALRQGGTLYYLLTDHLGSTAVTVNSSGSKTAELRYKPYGQTRYSSGATPTSRRFTGQLEESTIGLYDYGARFYDPALGRFISADPIVPRPGDPQNLNRYSYVRNNPLKYIDPTGHQGEEPEQGTKEWYEWYFANYGIVFTGADWSLHDYQIVFVALWRVETAFREAGYDPSVVKTALGIGGDRKLIFNKVTTGTRTDQGTNTIEYTRDPNKNYGEEVEGFVHEMGHIIDWHARSEGARWGYSNVSGEWPAATGWRRLVYGQEGYWVMTDRELYEAAPTKNAWNGPGEDFADTFTWWVYSQSGGSFSRARRDEPNPARQHALIVALDKFR